MVIFMHEFSSVWKDAGNLSVVLLFYFTFLNVCLFLSCVCGCWACMQVCASRTHSVCWGQEEGVRFSVAAVWVLWTESGSSARTTRAQSLQGHGWLWLWRGLWARNPGTLYHGHRLESGLSIERLGTGLPAHLEFKASETHFGILTSRIVSCVSD